MSRYTYAGEYRNPTESFGVAPNPDGEGFIITIALSADEILRELINGTITNEEAALQRERGWRPHTKGTVFDEHEDADEWIEGTAESFERDYDDYLEENSYALRQMEMYEMHRNEY